MIVNTALVFSALIGAWDAPGDGLRVGMIAPSFNLPRLTEGKVSSADAFRDSIGLLVIGSTEGAAPACRDWMLTLDSQLKGKDVALYQIAVLNNPWFVPHFAVKAKLKDYVPEHGYDKVLIEWGLGFAKRYHIPKDDTPRVVVIDKSGRIRTWHEGPITHEALQGILAQVAKL